MSALAEKVALAEGPIDPADPLLLRQIVDQAASWMGATIDEAMVSAAVQVLSELNLAIQSVSLSADVGYVEALTRIEAVLQHEIAEALADLTAGRIDGETLTVRYKGSALLNLIDGALVGTVMPSGSGARLAYLAATGAYEGGVVGLTGSFIGIEESDTVALLVNWGDGSMERVSLPDGADSFYLEHTYLDDQPAGTSAAGYSITAVLVVNGTDGDAEMMTASIQNLPPIVFDLALPSSVQTGMPVALSGTILDLGVVDDLTLVIDWGDGVIHEHGVEQGEALLLGSHTYAMPGTYDVSVTVRDDDGGEATESLSISVSANAVPVAGDDAFSVSVNRELVIEPPGLLDNDSDPDDDFLTVELVTGTIYGTLSLGQDGSFSYAPNLDFVGTDTFTYCATDGSNVSNPATVTITVKEPNEAPVITKLLSSAPEVGDARPGDVVTVTGFFADPDTWDIHSALIDWGDGTVTQALINETSQSFYGTHVYSTGGIFDILVRLSDEDLAAAEQTTTALVTGARVKDGELQIVGTRDNDHVTLNEVGKKLYKVHADFLSNRCRFLTFSAADVENVKILLGDGNDRAHIAGNIALPAFIDGGAGNDHLIAGGGPTTLIGGAGNDFLVGGPGDDRLYGGSGKDDLIDLSWKDGDGGFWSKKSWHSKMTSCSSWVLSFFDDIRTLGDKHDPNANIKVVLALAGSPGKSIGKAPKK